MANLNHNNPEENAILLVIGDYLAEKNYQGITETLKGFHSADIALLLDRLDDEDALPILQGLPMEKLIETLPELGERKRKLAAEDFDLNKNVQILKNLESDNGADWMALFNLEIQEQLLIKVRGEEAQELRELLRHDEDTAGGIMSTEVVSISESATVEEAISAIRKAVQETEQIYNVFVVNRDSQRLTGVLSLDKLLLAKPHIRVQDLMEETPRVNTGLDQEEVARVVKKYDLVEIPVVDQQEKLVGRITHDDIIDVIEEEAREDIAHLTGTAGEAEFEDSSLTIAKRRGIWLILGLAGGICSAYIMALFEVALSKALALAFFVPVITSMGGIVGIQSSSITVRSIAMGEILPGQIMGRVYKEVRVSFITGLGCGVALLLMILLWKGEMKLGLVVGFSMVAVMILATLTGTVIPIAFEKLKVDPGLATGPVVTTFNDILGLTLYFALSASLVT